MIFIFHVNFWDRYVIHAVILSKVSNRLTKILFCLKSGAVASHRQTYIASIGHIIERDAIDRNTDI